MRDDELVEGGLERREDAVDVLVRHHRDDAHQEAEVELLGEGLGERLRAGGVVRRVDENRWCTPHSFQSTRVHDGREAGPDRVDVQLPIGPGAEERLDGGECDRGVVRLVFTVQRQEDLRVHPAQSLQFEQLATDGDLS